MLDVVVDIIDVIQFRALFAVRDSQDVTFQQAIEQNGVHDTHDKHAAPERHVVK